MNKLAWTIDLWMEERVVERKQKEKDEVIKLAWTIKEKFDGKKSCSMQSADFSLNIMQKEKAK